MCHRSREDYEEDLYWSNRMADEESFEEFAEREMSYDDARRN